MRAVVGEHRVHLARHSLNEMAKEIAATRRVAFSCNSTKANLVVRSMATNR